MVSTLLEYEFRINFAGNFEFRHLELGTHQDRQRLVCLHQESLYRQLHFHSGGVTGPDPRWKADSRPLHGGGLFAQISTGKLSSQGGDCHLCPQ